MAKLGTVFLLFFVLATVWAILSPTEPLIPEGEPGMNAPMFAYETSWAGETTCNLEQMEYVENRWNWQLMNMVSVWTVYDFRRTQPPCKDKPRFTVRDQYQEISGECRPHIDDDCIGDRRELKIKDMHMVLRGQVPLDKTVVSNWVFDVPEDRVESAGIDWVCCKTDDGGRECNRYITALSSDLPSHCEIRRD